MNKNYIPKIYEYFQDNSTWSKLKTKLETKLKKFQKGKKKLFYIRYKYPHRKSISKYKSYVAIRRYIVKQRLWYPSKKNCLMFYNFYKNDFLEQIESQKIILSNYYI